MCSPSGPTRIFLPIVFMLTVTPLALAQRAAGTGEFGPVMTAYLGYLHNEQEVVDDRVSRREISAAYYRRNSNRIQALRQMAIKLVQQSNNDYVPELEAVTLDEFGTIFARPPKPSSFRHNEAIANKFTSHSSLHTGA